MTALALAELLTREFIGVVMVIMLVGMLVFLPTNGPKGPRR